MLAAAVGACGGSPELTIDSPADGTAITTNDPISIEFTVSDWERTSAEVVVDGTLLYGNNQAQVGTYTGGSCPSGPDDQITLVFQRP